MQAVCAHAATIHHENRRGGGPSRQYCVPRITNYASRSALRASRDSDLREMGVTGQSVVSFGISGQQQTQRSRRHLIAPHWMAPEVP